MNDNKSLKKAYWALAFVSFFWGTTFLASRIGVREIPGLFLASLRHLISGAIICGFFWWKGYRIPDIKIFKKIALQGFLMLSLSNGLMTWSVQYISSGLAAIIASTIPLLTVFFSYFVSGSFSFNRTLLLGLLIGFGGITLIFYEYLLDLLNPEFTFGLVLAFLSVLPWAYGTVYFSKHKPNVHFLFSVGLQMLVSGFLLIVVCYSFDMTVNVFVLNWASISSLVYLILIGSILSYAAYIYSMAHLPPSQSSIYAYINPIVAVFLGWLLLNERMNFSIFLGTAITIFGIYLVNNGVKKSMKLKL
jgi:drug/metabolite transporter (DMT)-like permease